MKRMFGMLSVIVATLLAFTHPTHAQNSDWKLELGLDVDYTIGRHVKWDNPSRSYFRFNMPNFTGFDPSHSLPPGEYDSGYVRPGIDPESGETEYWGADFENPGSLRLDYSHIELRSTSYTSSQEWNFTDHGGGSSRDNADSIMPMLRLTGWAPQDGDSNFRWGVTGGLGWSPIDVSTRYHAFDFVGYTHVDYTEQWDTFEIASGADQIGNAYYGDFGGSGPTLFFKPVSSRTEYWSDKYSARGGSDVEQSLDADLIEFRLGLAGEWQFPMNNGRDRLRLGIEGGPSLTVATGRYEFNETVSANIHEPELKSFHYSESDSSTDVLFGGYVQGRLSYQFDGNLTVGVNGGYSIHQDWEVGGAKLEGGNFFVGAFLAWQF